MKHSACMQRRRSPKSVRPRATTKVKPATKRSRRQEATPWIWAIWTTPARPMIWRQDRKNLTRGKSTLAKAPRSLTHQACTPLGKGKGKGGWPINGNCDHCGQFGHAWRHCPRLDEAGKAAMAQRKCQLFKGSQKGNNGMKGSWNGPSWTNGSYGKAGKGFQTRLWAQTQYGKGFGKQKGLNEVSDGSQDVWDLNGIHALTAVPSQAEFTHYSFTKPRSRCFRLVTRHGKVVKVSLAIRNPETHFRMEHVLKAFSHTCKTKR